MFEKVCQILERICDLEEEITPESRLLEDLAMTSMDLFKVTGALEDEFGVSIPSRKLAKMTTVADLVAAVEK